MAVLIAGLLMFGTAKEASAQCTVSFTFCPADTTFYPPFPPQTCAQIVNWVTPAAANNGDPGCGSTNPITVMQVAGPSPATPVNVGVYTIIYFATDANGASASCSFNVTVADTVRPTITGCPGDQTVDQELDTCGAHIKWLAPSASDACGLASFTTNINPNTGLPWASGDFFPGGTTTVTYTATDVSGNTQTCSFDVTVNDTSAPVITFCPGNVVQTNDPGVCGANVVVPDLEYDEDCPAAITFTLTGATTGGPFFGVNASGLYNVGVTTVTFNVDDGSGGTTGCSFTVTITDDEAPTVDCSAAGSPINVSNDPGVCGSVQGWLVTGSDNCEYTITNDYNGLSSFNAPLAFSDLFPVGTTTVTFTSTDAAGHTATCSVSVTVTDDEDPTITCPAGPFATGNDPGVCEDFVAFNVTASDNCGYTISNDANGQTSTNATLNFTQTYPVGGPYTVTFTVTDPSGNTNTCSATFSVLDLEAPVFSGCVDQTVYLDGTCSALITWTPPTANDNCDGAVAPSQTGGPAMGTPTAGEGSFLITYEVSDAAGNTATCSFTVFVEDSTRPTITCPPNFNVPNDPGVCGAFVIIPPPIAGDNCGLAGPPINDYNGSPDATDTYPVGTTVVTWTATDIYGNTNTCSHTVTVNDVQPPVLICEPSGSIAFTTDFDGAGDCFFTGAVFVAWTDDNCDYFLSSWLYDEGGALIDSAINQGPFIPGPLGGTAPIPAIPFTVPMAATYAYPVGVNTVVIMITDAGGNTSSCSTTVEVVDNEDPMITCPGNITTINDPDTCGAQIAFVVTASDNCTYTITNDFNGQVDVDQAQNINDFFPTGTTTVTFTATDTNGNTATCSLDITIDDVEPPTIHCPSINNQVTSTNSVCYAIVGWADPTDPDSLFDNCGGVIFLTQTTGLPNPGVYAVGTYTVEYLATDGSGNTATCSFMFSVLDTVRPAWANCPSDTTVPYDPNLCGATVVWTAPSASDNCVGVYTSSTHVPGDFFPVGTTTVTYTAYDSSGNTNICRFNVTVVDSVPPTIACPIGDTTVNNDPGLCSAVVTFADPVISDDCPGVCDTTEAVTNGGFESGSFAGWTVTNMASPYIPWTVAGSGTGGGGFFPVMSPSSGSFHAFNGFDGDGPDYYTMYQDVAIPAAGNLTWDDYVQWDLLNFASPTMARILTVQIRDLANNPIDTVYTFSVAPGSTGNTGWVSHSVDLSAYGGQTVRLYFEEWIPESFTGPAEIGFDNISIRCNNPFPNLTLTQISGLPSGSAFPVGVTTNTWIVSDSSGNTATCGFTVTVVDNEPPVISCYPDLTVDTDPGNCDAFVSVPLPIGPGGGCTNTTFNYGGAPVAIPGGSGTATPGAPAIIPISVSGLGATATLQQVCVDISHTFVGDLIVELHDPMGNIVTLIDRPGVPPGTFGCAGDDIDACFIPGTGADAESVCSNLPAIAGNFTATNGEDIASLIVMNGTWELWVTDNAAGDFGDVNDVSLEFQECAGGVDDNCGVASVINDYNGTADASDTYPLGTTTVIYTVTDVNGNTATCGFDITVVDNEAPIWTGCPADITVPNDPDMCSAVVSWTPPNVSDNCGLASVTNNHNPGETFPVGVTTVIYTAIDVNGNTGICTFDITVEDTQDPVIVCTDTIFDNDPGKCYSTQVYIPTFNDNCPGAFLTQLSGPAPGDTLPVGGPYTVEYMVTDAAGNTATCTGSITVIDSENPTTTCPSDIVVNNGTDTCGATVNYVPPFPSDNCIVSSVTQIDGTGLTTGDVFPVGVTNQLYVVEDAAGNTITCGFTVTVLDAQAPEWANCPADTTVTNDAGECGADVTYIAPTPGDNCGVTSVVSSHNPGDFFPVGTTTVTYVATDAAGHTAMCSFNVTVVDTEDPMIVCPPNMTVPNEPGLCEATVTYPYPTVTDNCFFELGFYDFETGPQGWTTGTLPGATNNFWNVYNTTAASGNNSLGTANDGSLNVPFGRENSFMQSPAFEVNGGMVEISFDTYINNEDGTTFDVESIEVSGDGGATWTPVNALPEPGIHTAVITSTWTHFSFTAPGATAGNMMMFRFHYDTGDDFGGAPDPAPIGWYVDNVSISSSSPIATQTAGLASGSVFPVGTTTNVFEVSDNAGNTATCSFDVTVEDVEFPVITGCPSNISVNNDPGNCSAVVSWTVPTADDNCGVTSWTSTSNPGDVFPVGTTTVVYTAVDAAGNATTCGFDITVTDNEAPVIVCPADVTVSNDSGSCEAMATWTVPSPTDNCGIANMTSTSNPGDVFPVGTTAVTYTVMDVNGNVSTCSFNVTVEDNEAPTITCPADTVLSNDPGVCGAAVTYVVPTGDDNCPGWTVTLIAGLPSGAVFPVGVTSVVYRVTDASGNTAECGFMVTVNDTEDPVINGCPGNITVSNDPGLCSAVVSWPDPTVSDNCGGVVSVSGSQTFSFTGSASSFVVPPGVTSITVDAQGAQGGSNNAGYGNGGNGGRLQATLAVTPGEVLTINVGGQPASSTGGFNGGGNGGNNDTYSKGGGGASDIRQGGSGLGNRVIVAGGGGGGGTNCFSALNNNGGTGGGLIGGDGYQCNSQTNYQGTGGTQSAGGISNYGYGTSGTSGQGGNGNSTYGGGGGGGLYGGGGGSYGGGGGGSGYAGAGASSIAYTNGYNAGNGQVTITYSTSVPAPLIYQASGLASGSAFPVGTTTVTYIAVDSAGNTDSCSFDVTVEDNEFPTITCPADINVYASVDRCDAFVNYVIPIITDNCPGATATLVSGLGSGSNFPVGVNTETWMVTDAAGHTATCSFTITVADTQAPAIACVPDVVVPNDTGVCGAFIAAFTQSVVVLFEDMESWPCCLGNPNGTSAYNGWHNNGSTTPDWSVDNNGTSSGSTGPNVDHTLGTSTGQYTYLETSGGVLGSFDELYSPPIDISAISNPEVSFWYHMYGASMGTLELEVSTNGTTWTQVFSISGQQHTSGTDPWTQATVNLNAYAGGTIYLRFVGIRGTSFTGDMAIDDIMVSGLQGIGFTDNCPGSVLTQIGGLPAGSVFPVGVTTNTFLVTDASGNTATCDFTVTVLDVEAPVFTSGTTLSTNLFSQNFESGLSIPAGWSASGLWHVTNTCAPAGAPDPTNWAYFGVDGTCEYTNNALGSLIAPTVLIPAGYTSATLTFDHAMNNEDTWDFPILIINGTPVANYDAAPEDVWMTETFDMTPYIGQNVTIEWNFDSDGSITELGWFVDNISLSASGLVVQDSITVSADSGLCGANVTVGIPTASDNCGIDSILNDYNGTGDASDFYPVGVTTVIWTATDDAGNATTSLQVITVIDDQDPTITCPADITMANDSGNCDAFVIVPAPVTTDNCTVTYSNDYNGTDDASDVYPVGTTTVVWTVVDEGGNTATCSMNITVEDTEAPTIECPADTVVPSDPGLCGAVVIYPFPVASDNCPGITVSLVQGQGSVSLFPVGVTTNIYMVTDAAGHTATCSFTVTVEDVEDPVIIDCPANIVVSNDPGNCSAGVTWLVPVAVDNCPNVTITGTANPGDVFPVGITTVVYTATDDAGNTSTCSFNVKVDDTEDPVIVNCPVDITTCDPVVTWTAPTATDNCNVASLTSTHTSGSTFPIGTTTVVYTATDDAGNVATCSFNITVNPLPTADAGPDVDVCNGSSVTIGGNPTASGTVGPYTYSWSPAGSLSNAADANPSASPTVTTTYTVVVTDGNGCTDEDEVTVTVNPLPTANAGADATICADGSSVTIGGNPTGSGTVGPYLYSWDPAAGLSSTTAANPIATPATTTTYTVTVTDANGCQSTDAVTITVNPLPDATITPAGPFCENEGSQTLSAATPGGTWSGNGIIDPAAGTFNPAAAGVGTHQITYNVTDANGCSNSASTLITVLAKPDAKILPAGPFCESDGPVFLTGLPNITPHTWQGAGVNAANGQFNPGVAGAGSHVITYIVTNANGCTDTATATIVVNALPGAVINGAGPFCELDPVATLTATVPGGIWSGPGIIQAQLGQFLPIAAGAGVHNIDYTVTNSNGCTETVSTLITVYEVPAITSLVTEASCTDASDGSIDLTVTGGTTPYTYQWSNGFNGPDPTGLAPGTYSVTVTDNNSCPQTASITVGVSTTPVVAQAVITPANNAATANGKINLTVTGGVSPYIYTWSNGETTEDISNLLPGNYTVVIIDDAGCSYTFTYNVPARWPVGGIDVQSLDKNIKLFPNPTSDVINVEITVGAVDANMTMTVYDVLGRKMYEVHDAFSGSYQHQIDMRTWASGNYMIRFDINGQQVTKKYILAK